MNDIDILGANANINTLCDWIEEYQNTFKMFHGYVNDPIDLDKEGCFIGR